jgi:hypothetical protein
MIRLCIVAFFLLCANCLAQRELVLKQIDLPHQARQIIPCRTRLAIYLTSSVLLFCHKPFYCSADGRREANHPSRMPEPWPRAVSTIPPRRRCQHPPPAIAAQTPPRYRGRNAFPIRKRIRSHVNDAHHKRTFSQLQGARTETPLEHQTHTESILKHLSAKPRAVKLSSNMPHQIEIGALQTRLAQRVAQFVAIFCSVANC